MGCSITSGSNTSGGTHLLAYPAADDLASCGLTGGFGSGQLETAVWTALRLPVFRSGHMRGTAQGKTGAARRPVLCSIRLSTTSTQSTA